MAYAIFFLFFVHELYKFHEFLPHLPCGMDGLAVKKKLQSSFQFVKFVQFVDKKKQLRSN